MLPVVNVSEPVLPETVIVDDIAAVVTPRIRPLAPYVMTGIAVAEPTLLLARPGTTFRVAFKTTALLPLKEAVGDEISPELIEKFCGDINDDALVALPIKFPENWPLTSRFTIVDPVLAFVAASIADVYACPPILRTPTPSELPINAVFDEYEYANSPDCNELLVGIAVVDDRFTSI